VRQNLRRKNKRLRGGSDLLAPIFWSHRPADKNVGPDGQKDFKHSHNSHNPALILFPMVPKCSKTPTNASPAQPTVAIIKQQQQHQQLTNQQQQGSSNNDRPLTERVYGDPLLPLQHRRQGDIQNLSKM
jgi:hypothetical protein